MTTPSIRRAMKNLLTWAQRGRWEPLKQEFFATHFEPVADDVDISGDTLDLLPAEAADVLGVFIIESFFTAMLGAHGELNVVDDYLERRGWRESVPARRYLKAFGRSIASLYEVVDVVAGRHVMVRDLVLGADAVRVEEKLRPAEATAGDRLAARIVAVQGKRHFTGAVLHFRHEISQVLLTVFEELAGDVEREMRTNVERWPMTVPVTRPLARELMVRTTNFSRILVQFWMLDTLAQTRAPAPVPRNTGDDASLR